MVTDKSNSVHAFNCFEEEDHVEKYKCHFRLTDLARDGWYGICILAIIRYICPLNFFLNSKIKK